MSGGMHRIALTGATGFIGRRLLRQFASAGHRLRVLTRRPAPDLAGPGVTPVPGALDDEDSLERLIADADIVVHAAGLTRASSAAEFHRINADAAGRLAALSAARPRPPRFILISSLAAREPTLSDYAASKRRGEEAVAGQPGLDWTILRPPAVYGPGDRATLEIFRLMKRGVLPVPPGGKARVSLIYVDDFCAAVGALLRSPDVGGNRFELRDACAAGYSWRRIAEAAGRYFGREIICIPVPKPLLWLAGHSSVIKCQLTGGAPRISPGKVRELCHIDWVCRENPLTRLTDWRPEVGIDEGFRRSLDWYREKSWL